MAALAAAAATSLPLWSLSSPQSKLTMAADVRMKWPFRLLVAGCSGCGKTTLVARVIAKATEAMTRRPDKVIVYYAHMQKAYEKLRKEAPCPVAFFHGGPEEDLKTTPGTLIVVDDLQASHAEEMAAWFTRKSHHLDTSVIYLVQNVFDKTPFHRTISLNATHIVLFKNPRDGSQVGHLDRQVFQGERAGLLTEAYGAATEGKPHSYVVVDFDQNTPADFRLRNSLLPISDFPNAYAYVYETQTVPDDIVDVEKGEIYYPDDPDITEDSGKAVEIWMRKSLTEHDDDGPDWKVYAHRLKGDDDDDL
jgi:hypothetical protein